MPTLKSYAIQDLGDLSPGLGCTGEGINAHGNVVGSGNLPGFRFHAILRRSDGQITDLGTLNGLAVNSVAVAINFGGSITGVAAIDEEFTSHAFLIKPGGQMIDLGTLADRFFRENPLGDISCTPGERTKRLEVRAFIRRTGLGRLVAGLNSSAEAINDIDQVVGSSFHPQGGFHAFFYSPSEGMMDLGTLGGRNSAASGINNSHQIVGFSDTRDGEQRAFLYDGSSGVGLRPADALPSLGGFSSAAQSIN
jgi:probable HAF family extracellular repeat protein